MRRFTPPEEEDKGAHGEEIHRAAEDEEPLPMLLLP